jgi:predicted nuclease with TOPRIM domain
MPPKRIPDSPQRKKPATRLATPPRPDPMAVLLEDIRSQNRLVLEAVHGLGQKLERDIQALRVELSERIERLEAAVRQNSHDIRKLEGRVDHLEARFDQLEGRFDKLEGRFDKLEGRFDRVETEVRALRQAVEGKVDSVVLSAIDARVTALERVTFPR